MNKKVILNGEECLVRIISRTNELVEFEYEGETFKFQLDSKSAHEISLYGSSTAFYAGDKFIVDGVDFEISHSKLKRKGSAASEKGGMISPMPGKILKVFVKAKDEVSKGDSLLVMEAMKMEHTIKADSDGFISAIRCQEGDQIDGGVSLVTIESKEGL